MRVVFVAVLFISFLCNDFEAVWLYLHLSTLAPAQAHTLHSPPYLIFSYLDHCELTSAHSFLAWQLPAMLSFSFLFLESCLRELSEL